METVQITPPDRIVEHVVDFPVPQAVERLNETVKVVRLTPHERVQRRIAEHVVEVPVPQILEEIVEVMRLVPQEQKSELICEQIESPFHKSSNSLLKCPRSQVKIESCSDAGWKLSLVGDRVQGCCVSVWTLAGD